MKTGEKTKTIRVGIDESTHTCWGTEIVTDIIGRINGERLISYGKNFPPSTANFQLFGRAENLSQLVEPYLWKPYSTTFRIRKAYEYSYI